MMLQIAYIFVPITQTANVGLSYTTEEDSLRQAFSVHGDIHEGKLPHSLTTFQHAVVEWL